MKIELPKKIDTTNVEEVETSLFNKLNECDPSEHIELDATKLDYISSVGLRLVLKIKKEFDDLTITNVRPEAYEIFSMTGFIDMIDIHKALREVSIEGCELIGKGAYGKVYRLSPDTIVKSYFKGNTIEDIDRERKLAREAFLLGIPTAISYDVVKVKEEKLGAVYELINSDSLLKVFINRPNEYEKYLNLYIDLLKRMESTEINSDNVPSIKRDLYGRLKECEGKLNPILYNKYKELIDELPESDLFSHGDPHFKNIFVTDDGLVMIDMDTIAKGNKVYDLGCLYRTYIAYEVCSPGNTEEFMGVSGKFTEKLFYDLMEGLFGNDKDKEDKINKIKFLGWFIYLSHHMKKYNEMAKEIAIAEEHALEYVNKVNSFAI